MLPSPGAAETPRCVRLGRLPAASRAPSPPPLVTKLTNWPAFVACLSSAGKAGGQGEVSVVQTKQNAERLTGLADTPANTRTILKLIQFVNIFNIAITVEKAVSHPDYKLKVGFKPKKAIATFKVATNVGIQYQHSVLFSRPHGKIRNESKFNPRKRIKN